MFRSKVISENTFVVSDPHFQHKNLCRGVSNWSDKSGCRDFDTLEQMNDTIIDSINDVVKENNDLIIGGDIIFGDKNRLGEYLDRIKCKNIIYLFGNHDDWLRKKENRHYLDKFKWWGDYLELFGNKPDGGFQHYIFFHYPIYSWNDIGRGSMMIYGHQHHNDSNHLGKCLCVSWEKFRKPLALSEIYLTLKDKQIVGHDYHAKCNE